MRGALISADLDTLHFKRRYAVDSQASTTTQQLINQAACCSLLVFAIPHCQELCLHDSSQWSCS